MILNVAHGVGLKPERTVFSENASTCIYFFKGNRMAEIECYDSGEIVGLLQDRTSGEIQTWDIANDEVEIQAALERTRDYLAAAKYI